jgi:hypothetical protein
MINAKFKASKTQSQDIILTSSSNKDTAIVLHCDDKFCFKNIVNGKTFHRGTYTEGLRILISMDW